MPAGISIQLRPISPVIAGETTPPSTPTSPYPSILPPSSLSYRDGSMGSPFACRLLAPLEASSSRPAAAPMLSASADGKEEEAGEEGGARAEVGRRRLRARRGCGGREGGARPCGGCGGRGSLGKGARVCLAARMGVGVGRGEGRIGRGTRGADWPKLLTRGDDEPSQQAHDASPPVIGQQK